MITARFLGALTLAAGIAAGQGRPIDWPFFGGDAQRSGWQKSDLRITKDNVKDFQLVLKRKLESKGGLLSLTPPVLIGNLISYKGFKELAFVQGSGGEIWSIDVDLNRLFWNKQLASTSKGCSGGVMATPTLTPPLDFGARPRPSRSPGIPSSPAAQKVTAPKPSILGSTAFGSPRPAFALSKDGKLHVLNTSTGEDLTEAIAFVPQNSRASNLVISDGSIYTTTEDCAGKAGAVWSLDIDSEDHKVASFQLKGAAPAGIAGISIGRSATVYVAGTDGSVTALDPKTLTQTAKWEGAGKQTVRAAPVVFTAGERDMIVAAGADGSLILLDSADMTKPVYQTPPVGAIWGGISSWVDTDQTRWILAPVWSAANSGSIVAFKVEESNGTMKLTKAWTSGNMQSPEPPVVTSGIVFALEAGGPRATLHALDGLTGKELYSTGNQVPAPANLNGLTVANGRVFFTTTDGTLYGFGIYMETLGDSKSQLESRSSKLFARR